MQYDQYIQLLRQRMGRYCDTVADCMYNGAKYGFVSLYSARENQTVLFKENIMDYTESREVCIAQYCCNVNEVAQLLASVPGSMSVLTGSPDRHHKSSALVLVVVMDGVTPESRSLIKKYRWIKLFKFGFFGWAVVKIVCIDLTDNRVCSNSAGNTIKKMFRPDCIAESNIHKKSLRSGS
jgi:hypothetical protein